MEVFIARLKQAREAFINNFLFPEIKKISKDLGFKNFPVPVFEEIDLKDDGIYAKIYMHLAEIGVLTPEETMKAIETNRLPDAESSLEAQRLFKTYKDEGLYQPLVGGPAGAGAEAGRPGGTPSPKTSNTVSPIGGSMESYSCVKLRKSVLDAQILEEAVAKEYKKLHKLKEIADTNAFIVEQIFKTIIANEEPEKWLESVALYINNPMDKNPERVSKINDIAAKHDVDFYMASLLLASRKT